MKTRLVISPKDFERIEYSILAYNLTANSQVPAAYRIRLVEFGADCGDFVLPKTSCSEGHRFIIGILPKRISDAEKKSYISGLPNSLPQEAISFTGKVKSIESGSDGDAVVTVQFQQLDEKDWTDFRERLRERLKSIQATVRRIKE